MIGTIPIPAPSEPAPASASTVQGGALIPHIERIRLFSPEQWEDFVLEWADSLRSQYSNVERCGGAGDMGRDVIAFHKDYPYLWDNYQCKHYRDPLRPTDVWIEFGKLVYYTMKGEYSWPSLYFFVAPRGVGTSLSNLLKDPQKLRSELKAKWDKHCRDKITKECPVALDSTLTQYIDTLDFSIFRAKQPLRMIDEHAETRWHVVRFGGGLPNRPPIDAPPATLAEKELSYVTKLLEAYADYIGKDVESYEAIPNPDLRDHFSESRIQFYSAESLRAFSRDTLPPGEFKKLQGEFYGGIMDEIRSDHPDGYRRVIAVVKLARLLQLSAHALIATLTQLDRAGICHQLANDNENVGWVR
jgi:hypothetical protein